MQALSRDTRLLGLLFRERWSTSSSQDAGSVEESMFYSEEVLLGAIVYLIERHTLRRLKPPERVYVLYDTPV